MKTVISKVISALALAATTGCVALVFVGCRTVSVQNNGEGKGWKVSVMSNMMKSEADNIKASVNPDGTISFDMGGYSSSPSEEFAKSLMTLTYIARIAAAMYSPAAASVPLTEQAADPQAVAALVKAQADAKAALVKAKAEAKAAAPAAAGAQAECTDCTAK
jgi:hypothetical protein